MKTRPVGADQFHAKRQTDMTMRIAAFRNFANAPKNSVLINFFFVTMIRLYSVGLEDNNRFSAYDSKDWVKLLTAQVMYVQYNVTLWCVCATTVVMGTQQYIPFVLLNMLPSTTYSCLMFPWKRNSGFPLHCCRDIKYSVLLSTI